MANSNGTTDLSFGAILTRSRYDIFFAVISIVGAMIAVMIIQETSSKGVIAGVITAYVLLIVITTITKLKYQTKSLKVEQLEREKILDERKEKIHLLLKTIEYSTAIMRTMSIGLQNVARKLIYDQDGKQSILDSTPEELKDAVYRLKSSMIKETLRNMVTLFESHPKSTYESIIPIYWFKVALFEALEEGDRTFLVRTYHKYPEGMEPYEETEKVDCEEHPRCAHVLAYRKQEIQLIENVKEEVEKLETQSRWENLRHAQSHDYESLACVPIVRGRRGREDRDVKAVLVIDTNVPRYFKENDRNFSAFIGKIFSPFRTLLTIVFDMEMYNPSIES